MQLLPNLSQDCALLRSLLSAPLGHDDHPLLVPVFQSWIQSRQCDQFVSDTLVTCVLDEMERGIDVARVLHENLGKWKSIAGKSMSWNSVYVWLTPYR